MNPDEIADKVARAMLAAEGTGPAWGIAIAFAYACNSRNVTTVAAQASVVFLDAAKEGDVLVAEAREVALAGRSGVTHVSVRTADGRTIAELQGYSRTLGGPVVET